MNLECTLCKSQNIKEYHKEKKGFKRLFYRCEECLLIFLDPRLHLPQSLERSRYEHHNNSERTEGYENFLKTLINPLKKYITPAMRGLDFGCGPYPMMCEMLEEEGFDLKGYDPYFFPEESLLRGSYDYVTCCEVAEHFNYPAIDFKILTDLVRPSGFLAVKTSLFDSIKQSVHEFSNWYYIKDDTHISIYSMESISWIAKNYGFDIKSIDSTVIILEKHPRQK